MPFDNNSNYKQCKSIQKQSTTYYTTYIGLVCPCAFDHKKETPSFRLTAVKFGIINHLGKGSRYCKHTAGRQWLNCSAMGGGDTVPKSETRLYVCQTHDKFHTT